MKSEEDAYGQEIWAYYDACMHGTRRELPEGTTVILIPAGGCIILFGESLVSHQ